jgi:hypothetical protein
MRSRAEPPGFGTGRSPTAWTRAGEGEVNVMNDEQKRAFDFVQSLLSSYGDHKKEREAYVIAVLYLGATAAALISNGWDLPRDLLLLALVAATLLTAALVFWQLANRRFAARMVAACTTVTSRWLTENPPPSEYRATCMNEVFWPDAVVQELRRVRSRETLILMIVIPLVILAWGGVVVSYFLEVI